MKPNEEQADIVMSVHSLCDTQMKQFSNKLTVLHQGTINSTQQVRNGPGAFSIMPKILQMTFQNNLTDHVWKKIHYVFEGLNDNKLYILILIMAWHPKATRQDLK